MHFLSIPLTCVLDTRQLTGYHIIFIPLPVECVISFGRCSAEQYRMLDFSNEREENPTGTYKPGETLVLIDGQESVQEMLVPLIKNPDTLCRRIREYLNHQPDISSLPRQEPGWLVLPCLTPGDGCPDT